PVSHHHADAHWGASMPMRPGILVLLKAVAQLWAAEDLYVARVGRVACFTARGAHCSGTQRRCTLAGHVPISRKWITCNGCALKMNPREFSSAGIPSSVARATMNGVSVDEIGRASCRERGQGYGTGGTEKKE